MTGAILFGLAGLLLARIGWEVIQRRRYARTWAQTIQITPPPSSRFPSLTFARLWASVGMLILGLAIGWSWAEHHEFSRMSIALSISAFACFVGAARNWGGER